jgi:predicted nuclease of predicted toxin-antitoxin system
MRFLIDRCAGTLIAQWLHAQGHDVVEARDRGPDPATTSCPHGPRRNQEILITIDTDFGHLVFVEGLPHSGLVRLPDVRSNQRLEIMKELIERFQAELEARAIITVRGGKIRISQSP